LLAGKVLFGKKDYKNTHCFFHVVDGSVED